MLPENTVWNVPAPVGWYGARNHDRNNWNLRARDRSQQPTHINVAEVLLIVISRKAVAEVQDVRSDACGTEFGERSEGFACLTVRKLQRTCRAVEGATVVRRQAGDTQGELDVSVAIFGGGRCKEMNAGSQYVLS